MNCEMCLFFFFNWNAQANKTGENNKHSKPRLTSVSPLMTNNAAAPFKTVHSAFSEGCINLKRCIPFSNHAFVLVSLNRLAYHILLINTVDL